MRLLSFLYSDCCTTTACQLQVKGVLAGNHQLADGHRIGIVLVVGISSILVDDSAIGGTSVQEVKRHMEVSCLFIGDAANEPAVTATFLTGYGDMFSYLSMGDEGLAPRRRTTLNKRQGGLTFVVFDGIGSHLQRTVDNHKLAQLFGQRTVGMRASNYFREVKDGGGEVGRSCQAAREGQRNGMGQGDYHHVCPTHYTPVHAHLPVSSGWAMCAGCLWA